MTSAEAVLGRISIQEKISTAKELFACYGTRLLKDHRIRLLLSEVKEKTECSLAAMNDLGVITECKSCEKEEGGSCCGRGIEDKYNSILLLINLLLERPLPQNRLQANSCFFLGTMGCCLRVRHVICVNYLCRKLQQTIPAPDLIRLQTINGEELDAVFVLHETVKRHLNQ